MKIAMMTNNYKPFVAGVAISVERLAKSLRKMGHQVVVFAPDYNDQPEEEDVVRYRALMKGVAGGFSVPNPLDPEIEQKFREGNFDVIHVHHPMMIGDTARYLSWKYQVPMVFTYHTRYEQYLHYVGLSALKGIMPFYIRNCTRSCDVVVAPTPLMKSYLEEIQLKNVIRVLPTGLERESFFPDEEKAAGLRKELLGDRRYLFCTVARLAKEKNLEFLLRSMKLRKESLGGDFRLALIGDGPYKKELLKQVKALGLTEEVVFVGKVPNQEIKNYCHAADLFVFASRSETQGIVLLESMAAGTPVLAVRASGTEDVVIDGVNGYMTEASETEFNCQLIDILEKKELEVLRQGARETAMGYSCEQIAGEAVSLYSEAIRLRNGRRSFRLRTGRYGIIRRYA